jgi:polysaccharide biosynthesis protein PslG
VRSDTRDGLDLPSVRKRGRLAASRALRIGVASVLALMATTAAAGALLAARTLDPTMKPPAAYAGRVGVAVSYDLYQSPESRIQRGLAQLHAGGVSWIREDLTWAIAEPEPDVFAWAAFDRLMKAAALAKVHVLGILDYSAPWASSDPTGSGDPFYPPKSDADFAGYAAAVVSRYGRNGSFWSENPHLIPDPLTALELWNEPYESWDWKPSPDPEAYAALVSQAARAIHAVDPHSVVLMAADLASWGNGSAPNGHPWLASLLAADPELPGLVNAIAVHPYPAPLSLGPDYRGPDLKASFGRVALLHQAEVAAGVRLPIWITEVGWSTAPDTPQAVSARTQARYSLDAIRRSLGQWGSYVSRIFLFGWFRSSGRRGDLAGNYGLLDPNGIPKPAWIAIAHLLGGKPGGRDPDVPAAT